MSKPPRTLWRIDYPLPSEVGSVLGIYKQTLLNIGSNHPKCVECK